MSASHTFASMRRTLAATALTVAVGALAVAQDAPNPFSTDDGSTGAQQSPFEGGTAAPDAAPASPFDTVAPVQPAAPATSGTTPVEEGLESPFDTSDPFASDGSTPFTPPPAPVATPRPAPTVAAPPSTDAPNPFGDAPDPFSASEDPFDSPAGSPAGGAIANPFGGSVPAPADDPFGSSADPFGAPADPFGGAAVAAPAAAGGSPFDPPAAPAAAGAVPSADPFGAVADPFGGSVAEGAPAADPFGGATTGGAPADPFGGGAPADPFGGGVATGGAPADPFGSAAPADPFGGGAPMGGAPADPFGSATAAAPAAGTDPFGASDQPVVPIFDAAQGLANTIGGDAPASPEATNPDGISQLHAWRYERTRLWDGTPAVARRKLTVEEAKQYDERVRKIYVDAARAGTLPGYDPAASAETWAEWAVFADQLQLWSEYVDKVVLAGFQSPEGGAFDMVQWPGQPLEQTGAPGQPVAEIGGGGAERLVAQTQSQSLDEQTAGFFEFNVGGGGQGAGIPASAITDQVVAAYNNVLTRLRDMEAEQEDFMTQFEARLIERNTRRIAYADWKADREQVLDDFIQEWNRRYSGKVSVINGVRYELYRPGETPEVFPRNTTPVVTDYELTPYDIINPDDGTLKQSRRD